MKMYESVILLDLRTFISSLTPHTQIQIYLLEK